MTASSVSVDKSCAAHPPWTPRPSRPPGHRVRELKCADRGERLLPCLVPGAESRGLSRSHPARLPEDRNPQYGPGRYSRTGGHGTERPQDSQRLRTL